MKRNNDLSIMELAIMIPVFALICAGALRLFAWSSQTQQESSLRSDAALACCSFAEEIKSMGGIRQQELLLDEDFLPGSEAVYCLKAEELSSGLETLGRGRVTAIRVSDEKTLYTQEFAWQAE